MKLLDKKSAQFSEFYSDYYAMVYSAVQTKVDNERDVEDITHEVFLRFFENMDSVENKRSWIFGTLKNVVLEYYRRKQPDFNIDNVFSDAALTFVNGFRDLRIIINDTLEDENNYHDDLDKIIFELVAIRNFTYKQAAKHLGLTREQTKYRYSLIIKRMIKHLNQRGIKNPGDLL